jgi:hypothetical protein
MLQRLGGRDDFHLPGVHPPGSPIDRDPGFYTSFQWSERTIDYFSFAVPVIFSMRFQARPSGPFHFPVCNSGTFVLTA